MTIHTHQNIEERQSLINQNPELDKVIEEVKGELRIILMKRRSLIEKLGLAFEKVVTNKESICEEIKNCLKEELALAIVSQRTIEQTCRPEWKKKTRPKLENENFSFSYHKPKEKQREIILDNHGSSVRDIVEDSYSNSGPAVDSRQDVKGTKHPDNALQRLIRTIRELAYENKKIIGEKHEIQVKLGQALELLQKQREVNQSQPQSIFDAEFSVGFRPLQDHMAQIFKSTTKQEVWLTVKVDANKKKVVAFQVGRKLLPKNVTETEIEMNNGSPELQG